MTYREERDKDGKITRTLEPDKLPDSQYTQGMQNRKMERQAIKGLTPKFVTAYNDD